MKRKYLKVNNWLHLLFAGILGLTQSCDIVGRVEYGTPNADFTFSGKVTDVDGNPIEGIEVMGKDENRDGKYVQGHDPSAYTDKNGEYVLKHDRAFPVSKYYLRFRDVDGELNGSFETVEKVIKIEENDYTGDSDGWFSGYVNIGVNTMMDEAEIPSEPEQ